MKQDHELELLSRLERLALWLDQVGIEDRARADEHAWAYAKLDRYDTWESASLSSALSVCRARAELADRVSRELLGCLGNYRRGG